MNDRASSSPFLFGVAVSFVTALAAGCTSAPKLVSSRTAAATSAAAPTAVRAPGGAQQACNELASAPLDGAMVTRATYVDSVDSPGLKDVDVTFEKPFCRVEITSTPAAGADIKIEV